jgi:HD-like signal output (HDOD) protein
MIQKNYSDKIESYIREMPSLPVSTGKVLDLCNKATVNPSELNQVISLDPVLTGRLLQLINSAYYGINPHVTSLVRAITMLGLNTVKNLTLTTAILATLPKNKDISGLNMEEFWRHCLCVGVTSKFLASMQGVDPKYHQDYFTAGLLHDIGKIPLNAVLSAGYMDTITIADRDKKTFFTAENDCLGINHCAAGEMIAKAWNFDSPLADIITWHHNMDGYYGEYLHILYNVAIADYFSIVYDVGFAGNKNPVMPANEIWEAVGLNKNSFETLKEKVNKEIAKASIFLNISQNS